MEDSQAITTTVNEHERLRVSTLDLSCLPPVYVFATHLSSNEQHSIEDALSERGAPLTYDIKEAKLVLGSISKATRAKLELRWLGVVTEDESALETKASTSHLDSKDSSPAKKKRKVDKQSGSTGSVDVVAVHTDSSTGSGIEDEAKAAEQPMSQLSISETLSSDSAVKKEDAWSPLDSPRYFSNRVVVVKLEWLYSSIKADKILPLETFTVLNARPLSAKEVERSMTDEPLTVPPGNIQVREEDANHGEDKDRPESIMQRANADPKPKPPYSRYRKRDRVAEAAMVDIIGKSWSGSQATAPLKGKHVTRPIQLLSQTTSEDDEALNSSLPSMPDWVLQNKVYSCERSTPARPPNEDFINLLKKIRLARQLTLDEIGVRAYSTSIASLAAYPYLIQSTREILALPGCDHKIAHLYHEYETNNHVLRAVTDLESDPALTCLRSFFEIWGVGAVTAREFYYDKGWRDLDDIIEYGWTTLTRVQQIGLKYYDEFHRTLSRTEVENIAGTITHHAKLVTDANVQSAIVGGYRRGKIENADVDVILSHPDEAQTANLITRLVRSLEEEGWISHTLTMNLTTTKRGQETLPINTGTAPGHGFDSLDKALVVWQDPSWPTKTADLAADPKTKNPNPHCRVDIIISPWRTVGCAVAGWTSGTTFQRDLRRYCKHVKKWKFDSSGVRERGTGAWVDLEGWRDEATRCRDWLEAEKRVFKGMGLLWRDPTERCTG